MSHHRSNPTAEAQVVVTAATVVLIAHMPLVVLVAPLTHMVALVVLVVMVTPLLVVEQVVAVVVCIHPLFIFMLAQEVVAYCLGRAVLVDTILLRVLRVVLVDQAVTQVATVLVAVAAAGAHLVVIQVARAAKP